MTNIAVLINSEMHKVIDEILMGCKCFIFILKRKWRSYYGNIIWSQTFNHSSK